jgi:phage terminase large subunit GpA-like protein
MTTTRAWWPRASITKYVKGFLRHVWEKTETERNEPLDLEVYAYAAAIYAGAERVNWDRLEAHPPVPDRLLRR